MCVIWVFKLTCEKCGWFLPSLSFYLSHNKLQTTTSCVAIPYTQLRKGGKNIVKIATCNSQVFKSKIGFKKVAGGILYKKICLFF